MSTRPTIKLKNLPVENPSYNASTDRLAFWISVVLMALVLLDIV